MSTSDGSTAANILTAALSHMRDRAATYDKPEGERSMGATVDAFHAVTGVSMTEEQGWLFMALLKAVRSQQGAYRADSYEDGAAYFALAGEAAVRDRKQESAHSNQWADRLREKMQAGEGIAFAADGCVPAHIDPADVEIATAKALTTERAELVQKLASEGFTLIGRINDLLTDAAQKHEDMGDWRNWKAGDKLTTVLENDYNIEVGRIVTLRSIEDPEYDGCMPVSVFYGDEWNWPEAQDGSGACVFKFHSRPSA